MYRSSLTNCIIKYDLGGCFVLPLKLIENYWLLLRLIILNKEKSSLIIKYRASFFFLIYITFILEQKKRNKITKIHRLKSIVNGNSFFSSMNVSSQSRKSLVQMDISIHNFKRFFFFENLLQTKTKCSLFLWIYNFGIYFEFCIVILTAIYIGVYSKLSIYFFSLCFIYFSNFSFYINYENCSRKIKTINVYSFIFFFC